MHYFRPFGFVNLLRCSISGNVHGTRESRSRDFTRSVGLYGAHGECSLAHITTRFVWLLIGVSILFCWSCSVAHFFLCTARAIENQCFVIAAAQFGEHNSKRSSYGHSLVVNPWGVVLADAGGVDSMNPTAPPTIITCEIDLTQIKSIQERMPIQSHRGNSKWN